MRPTLTARLGLAALLLAPTALPAQRAFEGTVTYQMTAEGMTMTMTQMSKGSKVRTDMEMPGMPGPMFMLMDMEKEVMQTVMPSMGMYMEIDLKQAMQMVPQEMRDAANQAPSFEALGTTDEIAGIRCQNYRFTQGDDEMEGCIATGMGFFMGGASGGPPGQGSPLSGLGVDFSALEKEFKDGMLPLRMKVKQNGAWSTVMEATAVERKSLDDSLFVLPSGLRKMNMPGGLN